MKRAMKQHPQCMSFTLMFPRLGKAFNYCKMIGSHARWWNDLVLSGDFILFHRVGNNASGVSPWWNYFLLSTIHFMQKVQFCWYDALINVHDILMKPPLRLAKSTYIAYRSWCLYHFLLFRCSHFVYVHIWTTNLSTRPRRIQSSDSFFFTTIQSSELTPSYCHPLSLLVWIYLPNLPIIQEYFSLIINQPTIFLAITF